MEGYHSLQDLLIKRNAKFFGNKITHTRIGNKDDNIYGGSFNIENDLLPTFHKLYYDFVFKQNKKEYLTEKQLNGNCIAIDLDFRYSHDITARQHTKQTINDIICVYLDELKAFLHFDSNTKFDVFVFEKPNVNRLEDGSLTKDGIHIIIGLNLNFKYQLLLRKRMLCVLPEYVDLPLINDWNSVLDEGISRGTTNWQLFGSRKPGNEACNILK